MDRMGHVQITTTQKYLHSLPDAEAARGLARFGFARDALVVAVALEGVDPAVLAEAVEDHGSRVGGGFLVSRREDGVSILS